MGSPSQPPERRMVDISGLSLKLYKTAFCSILEPCSFEHICSIAVTNGGNEESPLVIHLCLFLL